MTQINRVFKTFLKRVQGLQVIRILQVVHHILDGFHNIGSNGCDGGPMITVAIFIFVFKVRFRVYVEVLTVDLHNTVGVFFKGALRIPTILLSLFHNYSS